MTKNEEQIETSDEVLYGGMSRQEDTLTEEEKEALITEPETENAKR